MASPRTPGPLAEVLGFFLRLGVIAFGGPAAHIALMEREAVERRHWLTREHFLDLVGACNLLPGPGSTQVAMALGFVRAGWLGLIVAGVCFILPASLATLALAWAYVHYGHLPQATGALLGAKAVMVAIVVQAIWRLGHLALRPWPMLLLGAACFAAALGGLPPLGILLAAGCLVLFTASVRSQSQSLIAAAFMPAPGISLPVAASAGLIPVALVFLKLGVVVFGSGYVLLAFLQTDLVDRLHWVTNQQLLDAVTAGQLTPGPVFATSTFLGYLLHGGSGAAVATAAIFLPSFFMAGAVGALAGRLRKSPLSAEFLNGVNAAAVALMVQVTYILGRQALQAPGTWGIALASALLLIRYRVNATWLLLAGAALGLVLPLR